MQNKSKIGAVSISIKNEMIKSIVRFILKLDDVDSGFVRISSCLSTLTFEFTGYPP